MDRGAPCNFDGAFWFTYSHGVFDANIKALVRPNSLRLGGNFAPSASLGYCFLEGACTVVFGKGSRGLAMTRSSAMS
jgi:hypothetical protein